MKMRFHARHMPRELLNMDTPVGVEVRDNGLRDTLTPQMLSELKQQGVNVIEA